MIRCVLLSARRFWRSITAHIAAGIQPITVHCSTKQITALISLPLSRKDNQGMSMAISVISRELDR